MEVVCASIGAPEFVMPEKHHVSSPTLESRLAHQAEILVDWWRQIDRWVNEGGAEDRTDASGQRESSEGRHAR